MRIENDFPRVTFEPGDVLMIEAGGEAMVCVCQNHTMTGDFYAADSAGRPDGMVSPSDDPSEFVICPRCGRVYSNRDLFEIDVKTGGAAPCRARYEVSAPIVADALGAYELLVYGGRAAWRDGGGALA